jgi:hypothetical protein
LVEPIGVIVEEVMVVRSKCNGHRITGLYVGVNNVRRYFPKNIETIDLELDHLRIQCGLTPHFWKGEPEIHDQRLCDWLELKQFQGKGQGSSMLAMIPSGNNSFVLGPASLDGHGRAPRSASTAGTAGKQAMLVGAALPN